MRLPLPKDPNARVVVSLLGVVVSMGALAWASVPFYSWFCQTTGFGGTVIRAAAAPDHVLDQTIEIRFDANIDRGMPWEFKPVDKKMTVRIGETALAFYEAYNPTDHPIGGQAIFNVSPDSAGGYFSKIECFCFTEQVLQPGERVQMPVSFFVDPDILKDGDAKNLKSITLSYTMYQADLPEEEQAATPLATDPAAGKNATN